MNSYTLDIYLDDVNREYLNKLTFLALFKCRSLGFRCAADFFCEAFFTYDESVSRDFLSSLLFGYVCNHIVKKYEISYKEDLIYLLRHPSLMPIKIDPQQKPVRKKVLNFLDLDEQENDNKKEAYNYLERIRPVKRAAEIDRILEQYLIKTKNKYYIDQASARLLKSITENADYDEDGRLIGPAKEVVDTVWYAGSKSAAR